MELSKRIKSTGPGWEQIVSVLVQYAEAHGFNILQIKEKFGSLRFYYEGRSKAFDNLIEAAEIKAESTCEWCGAAGYRRKTSWLKTLCDQHEQEWNEGKRWWDEKQAV